MNGLAKAAMERIKNPAYRERVNNALLAANSSLMHAKIRGQIQRYGWPEFDYEKEHVVVRGIEPADESNRIVWFTYADAPFTITVIVEPEQAPAPAPEVDLLAIARETGLRGYLHGVNATMARELLADFVAAVEKRKQQVE